MNTATIHNEPKPMTTPAPGWCVHVEGHSFDLEYWQESLKHPYDPWCERVPLRTGETVMVLRSAAFCGSETADEVRLRALPMISQLNGALAAASGAEPLRFQWVGHILEGGTTDVTIFAAGAGTVRSKLIAHGEVLNPSGSPPFPLPPCPSMAQRWIKIADDNDDVADLLSFTGRADNWFDIYKALEVAERLAGGDEKQLASVTGGSWPEVKRTKQTANAERHAHRGKHLPPRNPTTLSEARSVLAFVVRTLLDSMDARVPTPD
jgi:hypothetical protein